MKRLMLGMFALGLFMRDAGTSTEGSGTGDGEAAPGATADDTTNTPAAPATPITLEEAVTTYLQAVPGEDKAQAVITTSGKVLAEIQAIVAPENASALTQTIVNLAVAEATKTVEKVTSAVLDSIEAAA